jgi:hypothetical protein
LVGALVYVCIYVCVLVSACVIFLALRAQISHCSKRCAFKPGRTAQPATGKRRRPAKGELEEWNSEESEEEEEEEGEVFECETPGCGFEHTYEGAGLSFCTDMSWPYRMLFFIETRMGRDK